MTNNMNDKTILLVDDETDIIELIEEVLIQEGFKNIIKAYDGELAISYCKKQNPDIIILDVMLPDIDGIEVCRKIRTFTYCPIIFLSAKNDDIDKILGLSSGGDDYITKPFSPRELVFRIKAQLRRQEYNQKHENIRNNKIITVGALKLDREAFCAYKNDKLLDLTAREFNMLRYLMENNNKIISKERIYEHVWGELSAVCDNTIMVHIRHLRKKIEEDPSRPKLLITVKGLGYKLVEGK